MTKFYLLTCSIALLLFSCKSANKSFQKGDYTQAIELGIKKLQKDPNDYNTRDLIKRSYNYEVTQHEDDIRTLSNSTSELRYDKVFQEYAHLQHLYELIHQYPAVAEFVPLKDYSSYLETYRNKAVDVHMQRGSNWMNEGTKSSYREAYREFSTALSYRPDDIDIRKSRDDAFNMAVVNIVVLPIQNYGGYNYSSYTELAHLQNNIMQMLSYHLNNNFVRFYTEGEARMHNIVPDQLMELNLTRIAIGLPSDNNTVREISKRVVVKETVYKPDSVIKEYATIKAKITTTQRTLLSESDLAITVRDPRGQMIWNDHFTARHEWKTQFATFTGDERALEDDDKKLLNQTNAEPPKQEQIMQDLLQQTRSDLSYHLTNYYNKYQ